MKNHTIALLCIVFFAFVLRFFHLGETPLSLEWDEVAIGYDAYSILSTGRDQFGVFLPNTFRSLDDWKPPLYIYATVPAVALFGLTDFAVRFPSAFFGTLGVLLTYFLVQEIFFSRDENERNTLALLSSFFLAISPWHLQFSRAAFETNLSVTVTVAAVFFFFRGIRGRAYSLFFSSVLFGLSLFSYHSTRVVTPLLLFALLFLFHRQLGGKRTVGIFFALYGIFWIFFFPLVINRDAQIRFLVTNDLHVSTYHDVSAAQILQDTNLGTDQGISGRIFHNRRISLVSYDNMLTVAKHYISHFSPRYLFVSGDAALHHAPGFGMMYFFDAIFLVLGGIFFIVFYRGRETFILPIWLLLGPLPASVTWQSPHSVRAEIILPTLQIVCAIGVYRVFRFLIREKKVFASVFSLLMFFMLFWGVGSYLHQYYLHTNVELSKNWLWRRKDAVFFTERMKHRYDRVLVSLSVDMPYIFWLYYTRYDPATYLHEGGTVSGGFADERNAFDVYEFRNFSYAQLPQSQRILLVGTEKDFPSDAIILQRLHYLDGTVGLIIGENRYTGDESVQ